MMSDKEKYEDNLIFNTHYLVRDVYTTPQLKELRDFIQSILDDHER